jgi:hypothetical protein
MKLSLRQLQVLRLLRRHLQEMIAATAHARNQGITLENQLLRQHLRWVERTLLEEHPDPDELIANMRKLEGAAEALVRVANDMIGGA